MAETFVESLGTFVADSQIPIEKSSTIPRQIPKPLVFVPLPFPGETMLPYLLRVSEENGYTTPADILRHAGLSGIPGKGIPSPSLLAPVFGWSADQIKTSGQYLRGMIGKKEGYTLMGCKVSRYYLRVWRPRICPACIREYGYHLPEWHLSAVIACCRHRCWLLDKCPRCHRALRWFRPGLLVCNCGADLSSANTEPASDAILRIVDLVVRVFHKRTLDDCQAINAKYPLNELANVNFPDLLRVIHSVGAAVRSNENSRHSNMDSNSMGAYLHVADAVFRDWPNGWYSYLDTIANNESRAQNNFVGLRSQFQNIYGRLFVCKHNPHNIKFIRSAFIEYGIQRRCAYIDKKLLKYRVNTSEDQTWRSLKEAATAFGVSESVIRRLISRGTLKADELKGRHKSRWIIDYLDIPKSPWSSRIYRHRKAAAYLGIPVTVFKVLRTRGIYRANPLSRDPRACDQIKLDEFIELMKAGLPRIARDVVEKSHYSTLDTIFRNAKVTAEIKADLIVAILHRKLQSAHVVTEILKDIVMSRDEVERFISQRRRAYLGGINLVDAAKLLGGDMYSIRTMIRRGLLKGKKYRSGWIVLDESLQQFNDKYVGTTEIARQSNTSTKIIIRVAKELGIKFLSVPRFQDKTRCYFLPRNSLVRLKRRSLSNPRKKRNSTETSTL